MTDTSTIINQLYEVFRKYKITKLDACPCGCISDKEEKKIYSKPLKDLKDEDLVFYAHKAMTTWGNLSDYKHFLPRILEIYSQKGDSSLIDLEMICNKLKYGDWTNWNEEEQCLIRKVVKLNWIEYVNHKISDDIYLEDSSYLFFFTREKLISFWDYPSNKIALRNFVSYIFSNGNYLRDRQEETFSLLLDKPFLIESLEKDFFEIESKDEEYATEISAVLQIIENQ